MRKHSRIPGIRGVSHGPDYYKELREAQERRRTQQRLKESRVAPPTMLGSAIPVYKPGDIARLVGRRQTP